MEKAVCVYYVCVLECVRSGVAYTGLEAYASL